MRTRRAEAKKVRQKEIRMRPEVRLSRQWWLFGLLFRLTHALIAPRRSNVCSLGASQRFSAWLWWLGRRSQLSHNSWHGTAHLLGRHDGGSVLPRTVERLPPSARQVQVGLHTSHH